MEDNVNENEMSRTVNLNYDPDVMSIWMPLTEQSTDCPIAIPQSIFKNFVQETFRANWKIQSKIFYSHLTESDSRVRVPLEHAKHPYGKTRENAIEPQMLTIEIPLKVRSFDTAHLSNATRGERWRWAVGAASV